MPIDEGERRSITRRYDVGLRQLADRTRGSYGLPCLATHMAVVVFGQLAIRAASDVEEWAPAIWVLAAGLIGVVAFSRLVAGSRFCYQVALSLATGALGVAYSRKLTVKIQPWREEWHNLAKNREHVTFLIVAAALAAAYVAAGAEDNSSWFFSIPNDEFVRVMRGVYGSRGRAPLRKTRRGEQYAPNDALSNLSARMHARHTASPVI